MGIYMRSEVKKNKFQRNAILDKKKLKKYININLIFLKY